MADKVIKSVRRVFEILELFDRLRRPLSAKEIASELDYPLASAHALMKSMHELGYARFDPPTWTYLPSQKFSALSDWLAEFVGHETQLLEFMEALNKETRETINLSRLTGDRVKIIYGLECPQPVGVSVKVGTLMPAIQSLTGMTALASLGDEAFSRVVERLEQMGSEVLSDVNRKLVEDVKRQLLDRGTVAKNDLFIQGIGAICLPIQTEASQEPMVIGVVGPSDRISRHEEEHRRTLRRLIAKFGIQCQFRIRNPRKPR